MITNINNIPQELRDIPQWVCFKINAPREEGQHKQKLPIDPKTGKAAKANDKSTWSDFKTAVNALNKHPVDGLGFEFEGSGIIGIDIDDLDKHPEIDRDFCNKLAKLTKFSYWERSQSGNGYHILVKCSAEGKTKALVNTHKGNVEVYNSGRFFALTGNLVSKKLSQLSSLSDETMYIILHNLFHFQSETEQKPVIANTRPVSTSYIDRYGLIRAILQSSQGAKFYKLYSGDTSDYASNSEADLAFLSIVCFWSRGDAQAMDDLYRKSHLPNNLNGKWDSKRGTITLGQYTINKVLMLNGGNYIEK